MNDEYHPEDMDTEEMSADDVNRLAAWVLAGGAEDNPENFSPPVGVELLLGEPDAEDQNLKQNPPGDC